MFLINRIKSKELRKLDDRSYGELLLENFKLKHKITQYEDKERNQISQDLEKLSKEFNTELKIGIGLNK